MSSAWEYTVGEAKVSGKNTRIFAVACVRMALAEVENPDNRSTSACDVAERYAHGLASAAELSKAHGAAIAAQKTAEWPTAASAAVRVSSLDETAMPFAVIAAANGIAYIKNRGGGNLDFYKHYHDACESFGSF